MRLIQSVRLGIQVIRDLPQLGLRQPVIHIVGKLPGMRGLGTQIGGS